MIHFQNYEEYLEFKNRRERQSQESEAVFWEEGEGEISESSEEKKARRGRTELVMENNTIYEIDTDCEECLKSFWRWKAAEQDGQR